MVKGLVAAAVLVVVTVGLAWFEPWRLVTSSTLDEALPTPVAEQVEPSVAPSPPEGASTSASSTPSSAAPAPEPPALVELGGGDFETAEHTTTGRARVIELADGSRFVRLEGLATSDGPDLHVWLSDAPSGGSWGSYDDGRYVKLGELRATNGNQNYEIPAGADLAGIRSVVIWCDRFDVAFGTAPVTL